MVVELLKFKVPLEQQAEYLQKDAQIWTSSLARYPGFLGKEVWIDPNLPEEVTFVIHWATRDDWKAIPEQDLHAISQRFDASLGFTCEMIESSEYQVLMSDLAK
ncbi:TIGR03792 family protein [Calothrix sp. UHCC 0171]|uniref:TIGR03792 family protein n=1 Tax=Calothrix sp. UHCC 0171 TaxID=3110245 RepID=UPI002B1FB324|nr:TIGR03792 family protein [Calothrix sp. UHCC 0171]MEA5571686.1 TIGR03792 family protein [Calothrix sp. UHCC 0171]